MKNRRDDKGVFTTPGPAFLASALINGDESALSDAHLEVLDWFIRYIDAADVVDCGEEYFSWDCCLYGMKQPGGTLVEYTCIALNTAQ